MKKRRTTTTPYERQYIQDNALKIPSKKIAKDLGRSSCFVRLEMKRQGIIVPYEIVEKFRTMAQFKQGHKPFNTGKKMKDYLSPEKYERMSSTMFVKGRQPWNTSVDGDVRQRQDSRGYTYSHIRISKGKWIHLHRHLYALVHGPIPRGCNVQFRDGDTTNVTIENLYLVSRAKQVQHNKKGGNKVPHELKQTIDLIADVRKATKAHTAT